MAIKHLNESDARLKPRTITSWRSDPEPPGGWDITLSCGHTIWSAIHPQNYEPFICAQCVEAVLAEIRHTQEPRR